MRRLEGRTSSVTKDPFSTVVAPLIRVVITIAGCGEHDREISWIDSTIAAMVDDHKSKVEVQSRQSNSTNSIWVQGENSEGLDGIWRKR
jgi:hypothetical protein